jgi:hypothetical protein
MQGIYTYTPETNHVSRVHNAAAILWLQFMAKAELFTMFTTLPSICAAPYMAVFCS